jgi:hypothetical protein
VIKARTSGDKSFQLEKAGQRIIRLFLQTYRFEKESSGKQEGGF